MNDTVCISLCDRTRCRQRHDFRFDPRTVADCISLNNDVARFVRDRDTSEHIAYRTAYFYRLDRSPRMYITVIMACGRDAQFADIRTENIDRCFMPCRVICFERTEPNILILIAVYFFDRFIIDICNTLSVI